MSSGPVSGSVVRRPATPGRVFREIFAFEARSKGSVLALGVVLVLLLDGFIAWRVQGPQLQALVALIVALVPSLYWVFGGLAAFWSEFGSGAHLLLRSLPASGLNVVFAKYLWLLVELAVLTALLLGSALYFLNGAVPLAEVRFTPALAVQLGMLWAALLLVPPAIAVAASVVGRASRLNFLAGFLAFALLWWAYALLSGAVSGVGALGSLTLDFPGLPRELCAVGQLCFVRLNTAVLLFQPVFAAITLWIAGRAFDSLSA